MIDSRSPVAVVTPTRGRPRSLALLAGQVQRFTIPVRWIVATDDLLLPDVPDGTELCSTVTAACTYGLNYAVALDRAQTAKTVIVCEDNDWYPPDWAERCVSLLQALPMAITLPEALRFYHLKEGAHREKRNATAMMAMAWSSILHDDISRLLVIDGSAVEQAWWERRITDMLRHRSAQVGRLLGTPPVAFKGTPEDKGLRSHFPETVSLTSVDPGRRVLRSWIGAADADAYLALLP
jgi:hypothetical protein